MERKHLFLIAIIITVVFLVFYKGHFLLSVATLAVLIFFIGKYRLELKKEKVKVPQINFGNQEVAKNQKQPLKTLDFVNAIERDSFGSSIWATLGMNQKSIFPRSFDESKAKCKSVHKDVLWNDKKIKKSIDGLLRPSLRIDFAEYGSHQLKYGSSKFGGKADLDEVTMNSIFGDNIIPFLCQINLKELSHWDLVVGLPKQGILYFFFEYNEDNHADSKIKVHYQQNVNTTFKKTSGYKTQFYPIYTFPEPSSSAVSKLVDKNPLEEDNIDHFRTKIGEKQESFWYDSLLFAEPLPLQEAPFETDITMENHVIPILEFAYKGAKYHIGVMKDDFKMLDFSRVIFTGANT